MRSKRCRSSSRPARANIGGSGAVSINFQTRSGTNRFSGTAYEYFRHPALNTNNWINERNGEPKNDVKLNQYGARVGGPIVIPGLYDGRGKAFYMVHYEQLRFPNSFTRTRTILNPARAGRQVPLQRRRRRRARSTCSTSPRTTADLRHRSDSACACSTGSRRRSQTSGTVSQNSDPMLQTYAWQSPGKLFEHQPTLRIDYNLTDKHRLSGSYADDLGQARSRLSERRRRALPRRAELRLFTSTRPLHTLSLRSTLSQNLVSELRGGITAMGGSSNFGDVELQRRRRTSPTRAATRSTSTPTSA